MRFVAMRLHTKDQAPKEGGQKAAEQPFQKVLRRNFMHCAPLCGDTAGLCSRCLLLLTGINILQWEPTREGYLRFLVESKTLFKTLEDIVAEASHPECERPSAQQATMLGSIGYSSRLARSKQSESCNPLFADARFQDTGLERSAALAKDIDWFKQTYGLEAPEAEEDGPGQTYARQGSTRLLVLIMAWQVVHLLRRRSITCVTCLRPRRRLLCKLAANDPPAFICHFYNVYFAHSAGGRMIGKKVSSMCLDDAELNFYQWDGELSDLLGKVLVKAFFVGLKGTYVLRLPHVTL